MLPAGEQDLVLQLVLQTVESRISLDNEWRTVVNHVGNAEAESPVN